MKESNKLLLLTEKIERLLLYPFKKGWIGIVFALIILLFILGAGLSALSNSAKPGDNAFFIDRAFEKLRVATSFSDSARFKYKVVTAEERLLELNEFDQGDTNGLLGSLDEIEIALLDIKSEIANVNELSESQESANKVIDNLLDLVARYRAFLLGETDDTEDIQQEFDESIEQINDIVSVVQQDSPSSSTAAVAQTSTPKPAAAPAQTTTPTTTPNDPLEATCNSTYQNLGGEVEKEGVTLQKNSCGEYTYSSGSTTYILITNDNLDYAVGQRIKYHGSPGTNNSIFLTEFEIDD